MIFYDWALGILDFGGIPIIAMREGDMTGFAFEVDETAHTEGVPMEELIAKVVECHTLEDSDD